MKKRRELRRCLVENTPRDHAGRRYGLDDFAGRNSGSEKDEK